MYGTEIFPSSWIFTTIVLSIVDVHHPQNQLERDTTMQQSNEKKYLRWHNFRFFNAVIKY